ncbi:MAG: CRTAC1 family protein [Acidobacteriota bacterium]|nr:CRTAC1 family protein [Acidobacteriota bacterium]
MTDHDDQFPNETDDAVIGVALKRSALVILAAVVLGIIGYLVLRKGPEQEEVIERAEIAAPEELDQRAPERPAVTFQLMDTGASFTHQNGAQGEKLLPETMGGGVAVFDYNGDGHQDILFVNSRSWKQEKTPATHAMYRNDGKGNFTDVTEASGLALSDYGMGVACADVDGDGDTDLFLSNLGPNRFLINRDGRFEDETDAWGLAGEQTAWSTSAGFFDYDNDGDLDLFVCNYVTWNREIDLELNFTLNGKDRAYGPPIQYPGTHNYLYRNDGGKFTDVSAEAGIQIDNDSTGQPMGKALAVTFADPDRDGLMDIFVANDTVENFVFRNEGNGRFTEEGTLTGIAFDDMGAATGAMGMDAAYFAGDQRLAVSIANFATEATSFFVQQGADPWQFADMTNSMGVGSPSRLSLSFGLFFFDYDLDGRLDLLQVNGHLEEEINTLQSSQHYRQAPQLFWNTGLNRGFRYVVTPYEETGDLSYKIVGRGSAYGDFDADGDLDVVLMENGGPARLLRNAQSLNNHWLRLTLRGKGNNTDAIGALVKLTTKDGETQQRVMPTRSYLSQVELPLTFGLGASDQIAQLTITWPDGQTQEVQAPEIDTHMIIEQQ